MESSSWAVLIAIFAGLLALIAIILACVLSGKPGPQGPQGVQGAVGNPGTKGGAITNSASAVVAIGVSGNAFTLPQTYNTYDIVIPKVSGYSANPYFLINADQVSIGDVFAIDNTNNPTLECAIQYSNFSNNLGVLDETTLNNSINGRNNSAIVEITASRIPDGKNIFIFFNAA